MRKSLLAVIPALWLTATLPALAQGLQTPAAPNGTPPAGTLPNGRTSTARRTTPTHRSPVHRHVAASQHPARPVSQ